MAKNRALDGVKDGGASNTVGKPKGSSYPQDREFKPSLRPPRPPSPDAAATPADADRRNLDDVLWLFDKSHLARFIRAVGREGNCLRLAVADEMTRSLLASDVTLIRILSERLNARVSVEIAPRPGRGYSDAQEDGPTAGVADLEAARRLARKINEQRRQ